jgi:transposase-like protein
MQCTTKWGKCYLQWGSAAHTVAVVTLVLLLIGGHQVEGLGGWLASPPRLVKLEGGQWAKEAIKRRGCGSGFACLAGWTWMKRSWVVVAVRSEALLLLTFLTGHGEWQELCLLPWVIWGWKGLGVAWPELGRQPLYRGLGRLQEEVGRLTLLGLVLVWLAQSLPTAEACGSYALPMLGGMVGRPSVEVEEEEGGWYYVRLSGEFELHLDGNVEFHKRMLVIFLGLLEVAGESRGSRRTRDGRTPFVRQERLAMWFGVPQPHISRWLKYWLERDWRRMLSQKWGEVLTEEVRQRVINSWAAFPWWSARRMWQYLRSQGSRITLLQVKQVGRESGWTLLRQQLRKRYQISAESFRPRDEWLVSQLLGQVQRLVERLEALGGLTPQEEVPLADLKALCEGLELRPAVARRALPWLYQLEHMLFGRWELVDDGRVRCLYCGTTDVSHKSRKPRWKRYVDERGEERKVAVYRYYCHNPACKYKTFTNLPPNLVPYSKWTIEHHLAALQMYEWSHSIYRCTSQMLGVSKMTAYRWVSGFGYRLLPVAAIFGIVRSSGVVGIDEKYVLVPKNDKPEGKMKRWMYVYLAVDCYTYDLLHIEIYPYNTKQSAHAFFLALRAKGYYPRVVVTDMRVDYRDVVAQVFPTAVHHECIFHALQEVREHAKVAYGTNYAETHPEVERLLVEIDHIFDARTKRTARRRYEKVLAQRETFVTQTPDAAVLFDFLGHHWPYLVNAIESRIVPTTNNATEEVIRLFTQHYKTFCGFENIESARLYLGVFEKVHRFTPFSDDAQERIRGKCPLELAGYQVQKLPMTQLLRGLALQWPASAFQELVPNV